MRTTPRLIGLGLAAVLLAACGKQDTPAEAPAPAKDKATSALASNAPVEAAPLRGTPDFGGTTQVAREADGIGSTPGTGGAGGVAVGGGAGQRRTRGQPDAEPACRPACGCG